MSDTLTNALAQSAHSQSVLAGIQNPAVVNPLAGMGSAISAVSGMQGLQEKAAQQLAGQAYQGAINQATGEFDPNKFRTLLAQSGSGAAMAAGAALLNTQNISSDQLKQSLAKAQWVNSTAGAALLQGDYSDATMLGLLHRGVAGGILTLPEAQKQLADMPPDAAGRKRWLEEHRDTSGSYVEQTQTQYGTPGSEIDPTGRRVGTVQQSPRFGGGISTQPQPGVPLGLDPGQSAAYQQWLQGEVEIPDPNNPGGKLKSTRLQQFQRMGVDPRLFYPGSSSSGGQPPASPNVPSNAPPASPNVRTPPPSPKASPNAGSPLAMPSEADIAAQKASADQYSADNTAAGTYQQRIFPLVQAASILKSGDVVTGQGAEAFNRVKSFLMTQATNLGADVQTIQQANFDKVAKYLQQYVNQQGMSGRSDQALASAVSGNPSAHISTLANEQILPAMIGMERMRQAIITEFKAQNGHPANYSNYASDWQNKHDPRAFIFDMLDTTEQRQKIMDTLKTPAQRKAFSDTLDIVERNPGIMGQAVMPGH